MVTLNTALSTIGITQAKGVDLVMQRDQMDGTLPRSQGNSGSSGNSEETRFTRQQLTPEQRKLVDELKQIDRNVRAHEAAHVQAGQGVVTSGANFTYTYGPDGKQYAVGGEVGIDTSPERNPESNIDKGQRIQMAALAPRDPSPQDYRVAGVGSQLEAQGRSDLAEQQRQQAATETESRRAERQQTEESPERPLSSETPAARLEQAPNAEPVAPLADMNDAARQRVAQAYAPRTSQADATFSVFA